MKDALENTVDFFLNFLPNQDWFFLVYLFLFFVFSVGLIYLGSKTSNNNISIDSKGNKKELTIDDLLKIASNPKSKTADLLSALMLFNENFKVEQNEKKSIEFFEKVLNHKNRNKAIFDYFHGTVLPSNLKYKNKLDEIERKALNK
ncbi:MAG: hypothetical protein ABGX25_02350 [Nautiliaceae bacterium]